MKDNKFKFPKPTAEELDQTAKLLLKKYDVVIPKPDLEKLVNLIKELDWWLEHKREPGSPIKITEKDAIEFKDLLKKVRGIDISVAEAYDEARSLLGMTEYKEKERLSKKIRAILVTYIPIPRNESVEDKIKKLFELQYAIDLTQNQIEHIAQYLTRVLWYEDGLDESLDNCLDDLLVYADKAKRGKRTNGINSHNKLRQTLDEVMGKLNIPSSDWERFYKED